MAFERISLNIIPDGVKPVVHVSQFDVGRPIIIDLYNGDDAYTPAAGVTFELHCRKVDDNIVTLDTYEVDGNTITFASTEQLCACSGDNLCEVAIMLDDLLMGTLNFILHVERDPLAGGLTSETSIYNLTEQIDDIISGEGYVKDTDLDVLQSDWDEADPTSPAYIKNKPSSGTQVQSDWTEADITSPAYIKNKPTLATVATSGDYDDLLNKPAIPDAQVQSDWNQTNTSAVDFIKNKPVLPFESKGQYLIKTTPVTKRSIEFTTLIGGTVAFNQLVQNGNFANTSYWSASDSTISASDNVLSCSFSSASYARFFHSTMQVTLGHKYILMFSCKSDSAGSGKTVYCPYTSTAFTYASGNTHVINETWKLCASIFTPNSTASAYIGSGKTGYSTEFTAQYKNFMLIDLTAMFGSTIADYIYLLEQATAGAGVAWFKALFPNDYYAYNAGGLLSVKTIKKINRDSNNVIIGEYQLDDIELRGILKLDSNNNLYYDGDTYNSSGEVVRRFEYRAYASGDESLPDTITDGTNTVTKLVTPTTETADPFTNPMVVDENGTEEFVDGRTVEMLVGNDTFYIPMN